MNRHELTDAQWGVIAPLLPQRNPEPGRRRADDLRTLNGIVYVLKTGCAWVDFACAVVALSGRYPTPWDGSPRGVYRQVV
jgi:transposase